MGSRQLTVRWLVPLGLMLCLAGIGWAAEKCSEIVPPGLDLRKRLPAEETLHGESVFNGDPGAFTSTIRTDPQNGQALAENRSDDPAGSYRYTARLDDSLRFANSEWRINNRKAISFFDHDQRLTRYDPIRHKMTVQYFRSGVCKSTKEFVCDGNTVDSDVIPMFLRGLLLSGIKPETFDCDVIFKGRGLKLNVRFELVSAADLQRLSPEYAFPERFRDFSRLREEAYVFVIELTGAAHLFYPHKHYFAYKKTPPYGYVAIWGGKPTEFDVFH